MATSGTVVVENDRSWVEISLPQLKTNLDILRNTLLSTQKIMAVVKADAYGHGDQKIASFLQDQGIHHFAVSNIDEGIHLRKAGISGQILILGYTSPLRAVELLRNNLTQALLSEEYAEALASTRYPLKCQFAIDTGMNRIGLDASDPYMCESVIRKYQATLKIDGLFTHLCVADSPIKEDIVFTEYQIAAFKRITRDVADLNLPYCHFLNSAGGLWYKDASSSLVRYGIVLYGLKPDYDSRVPDRLLPILTWKTVVSMVKDIYPGETVGYGRSFFAERKMKVATLPTGYADGYPRALSNRAFVIINGQKAPVIGRICMDQMMVDVTDIENVSTGMEVVLIGGSGKESITADDLAKLGGTIGYEVVCGISKRVPRIYKTAEMEITDPMTEQINQKPEIMNVVLQRVKQHAAENPDRPVYIVYDELTNDSFKTDCLTWAELDLMSDRLSGYICRNTAKKEPLVVYGHKSKYMLVCFMACVKSGHAYCPVDTSIPSSRVQDIIDCVEPELILAPEDDSFKSSYKAITLPEIESIIRDEQYAGDISAWVKPEDVFYIIFTSGSTGKPKGVQITTECCANYLKWAQYLGRGGATKKPCRFLNQAPFSFDLSVMDIYMSLYTGGTICAVTKNIQRNTKLLYKALEESNIDIWVSTPSFADICLADKSFSAALLKNLKAFLFCGEILTNKTAERLKEQFPDALVVNTYGPTESTVCVTEVVVDDAVLAQYSPLPVGAPKPGTWIYIVDEDGNHLPDGEQGEIVIVGDTVSIGYFKNPQQTEKVFSTYTIEGREYRLYHTGDRGYLKDGYLFYNGRIDFQIKLHGYRIEIEDIENNLVKIPGVEKAVVLSNVDDNRVKSLTAFVVYNQKRDSDFAAAQSIRQDLKQLIPEYMVPKKIRFVDSIPMTINGKADRKALEALHI